MSEISSGCIEKKGQRISYRYICVRVELSKNGGESSFADFFFMRGISSAILLSSVLIHLELIPSGKFIMNEQKNRAIRWPTLDFLQAPVVKPRAEALLLTLSRTGYGSSVAVVAITKWM